MTAPEFRLRLRDELQAHGLLADSDSRDACAARARALGDRALAEVAQIAGAATMHRALSVRRGQDFARTYRYVAGYGELMTEFLIAPVGLPPAARDRVARLGAIANLIVSHFDEMVDGGWPRVLLLPRWALALAATRGGRALLRAGVSVAPSPSRLTTRLVAEYFRRVAELPYVASHARARSDLRETIADMYAEEGRTPREWRRLRGDASAQKKTALPFVVLGLPAWLASPACPPAQYARHRRWLVRMGRFIRWVDDAADLAADSEAGSANLVRRASARRGANGERALAARIAKRGRWVMDEWCALVDRGSSAVPASDGAVSAVVAAVLVAWVGAPEHLPIRAGSHRRDDTRLAARQSRPL